MRLSAAITIHNRTPEVCKLVAESLRLLDDMLALCGVTVPWAMQS